MTHVLKAKYNKGPQLESHGFLAASERSVQGQRKTTVRLCLRSPELGVGILPRARWTVTYWPLRSLSCPVGSLCVRRTHGIRGSRPNKEKQIHFHEDLKDEELHAEVLFPSCSLGKHLSSSCIDLCMVTMMYVFITGIPCVPHSTVNYSLSTFWLFV